MNNNSNNAAIPVGFRFHPTDEELVGYYLHGKVTRYQQDQIILELDLYKIEPWDLHEVCRIGDDAPENQNNWYFFSHKDKKYPTGNRANRATAAGFWKATGRDKPIHTQHVIGMRKTLVFYKGRAPHGEKTDWIMHEFRLDEGPGAFPNIEADGWVVCRVFRKTKIFKTKNQGTSRAFEDQQLPLLPELTSSPEKFSSDGGDGGDDGGDVDYPPALTNHFNTSTCKQEISVDDYGTPAHIDPFLHNIHHGLDQMQKYVGHPHATFQPPCSSSTFRSNFPSSSSSGRRDSHDYSSLLYINEFEATRSTIPQEGNCFPVAQNDMSYWMFQDEPSRYHTSTRLDQSLADVTCHVPMKVPQIPSDHLVSGHELAQLWNVL